MKNSLLILITTLFCTTTIAGNHNNNSQESNNKLFSEKALIINTTDTVVFDLSKALAINNYIEFPVYIVSDDTVYSLDFSLKYDQTVLTYDSIINLTSYLQPFSYYNTMDSTLRFTSYSLQRIQNDTALVSIRFNSLSGQVCSPNLNTLKAYLNGDFCSYKVTNCPPPTAISNSSINDNLVKIYPNPVSEVLHIEMLEKANIQLYDIDGRNLTSQTNIKNSQKQCISTQNIANGIYIVKIYNDSFVTMKKIIINK